MNLDESSQELIKQIVQQTLVESGSLTAPKDLPESPPKKSRWKKVISFLGFSGLVAVVGSFILVGKKVEQYNVTMETVASSAMLVTQHDSAIAVNSQSIEKNSARINDHLEDFFLLDQTMDGLQQSSEGLYDVLAHKFGNRVYFVQEGDTLASIAELVDMPLSALLDLNPHLNIAEPLYPGQRIFFVEGQDANLTTPSSNEGNTE